MATLLNTTDPNNRLIEALGSAALFSDNTSASSPLGLPLSALALGGNDTALEGDQTNANGQTNTPLDVASLLGSANGEAGFTNALPLDQLLNGLPVIGNAEAGGILSGLDLGNLGLGDLGLGTIGGTQAPGTTPLDLAGAGTLPQPIFDAVNALIKDVHVQLETLSHQTGTADLVHSITNLGETVGLGEIGLAPAANGASNLITDTLNLPGDILSGNLNGGISNIGHDLTDTIHATTGVVDALLHGNDPTNPLPEIINGLGSTLQTLPLLSVNGGNNGGLLGGVIGDLSHSSSGHLVDADVGPQQSNGLVFDLLSAPSNDGHTASVNAVDVGPAGPHLLDLGLLTGSGSDGLAGNLLGGDHGLLGGVAGGATAPTAVVAQVIDIVPVAGGLDHGLLDLHGAHII